MRVRHSELRCWNILNAGHRMSRDAEHLSPSVVRGINCCYGRVDYARQRTNLICKLIAEARDCARVRVSNSWHVKMAFQQVVLAYAQTLALQTGEALNYQACCHQ